MGPKETASIGTYSGVHGCDSDDYLMSVYTSDCSAKEIDAVCTCSGLTELSETGDDTTVATNSLDCTRLYSYSFS